MERQRFFGISMAPSLFQRSSGGAEESVKSVLSIWSIRVDVQEQKHRFKGRKALSSRKLARQLGISPSSVQRILKNDREPQA